jgi:hypothetical protein
MHHTERSTYRSRQEGTMSATVTLKKTHFQGQLLVMSDGVSNGRWAIRKTAIVNAAIFATAKLAGQSLGIADAKDLKTGMDLIMPRGEIHEWKATKYLYSERKDKVARVFQSTKTGEFAGIDVKILTIIGLADDAYATLYGVGPNKPFVNATTIDEATFVAMPYRIEAFPQEPTR